MENKIFSKFNIYDQIGYLLVGGIGLLVIIFNFVLLDKSSIIPVLNTSTFIAWFIVSYFLGHVLQAIANIIIKENKTEFSDSEQEILNKAKDYFKLEKQSLNELYLHCYMLASAKDVTGQVQSFNAYYSLYRGWYVVFLLESIFLLWFVLFNWFSWHIVSLVLSVLLAVLFFRRLGRFYSYSRAKTLQTFSLLTKNIF